MREQVRPNFCCKQNLTMSRPIKSPPNYTCLWSGPFAKLSSFPSTIHVYLSFQHFLYYLPHTSPISLLSCHPCPPASLPRLYASTPAPCLPPAFTPALIWPPSCFSCLRPYPSSLNPVKSLAHPPLPIYCPYLPHPTHTASVSLYHFPSTILVLFPFTIIFIIPVSCHITTPTLKTENCGLNTGYTPLSLQC